MTINVGKSYKDKFTDEVVTVEGESHVFVDVTEVDGSWSIVPKSYFRKCFRSLDEDETDKMN